MSINIFQTTQKCYLETAPLHKNASVSTQYDYFFYPLWVKLVAKHQTTCEWQQQQKSSERTFILLCEPFIIFLGKFFFLCDVTIISFYHQLYSSIYISNKSIQT